MKKSHFFTRTSLCCALLLSACGGDDPAVDRPLPKTPVLHVETPAEIPATGGEGTIRYTLTDPAETPLRPTVHSDADWLHIGEIGDGTVAFRAEVHTGDEPRTAQVTLSYPNAEPVEATLRQAAPSTPRNLTFDIRILETASRSVVVECIPSDPEATYIAMATHKEEFDAFASDEAIFADNLEYFYEWGPMFGATSNEESIAIFLRRGTLENYDITLDSPSSDYYFYAYGMNSDGTITSPRIFKEPFSTTDPEQKEIDFRFAVRPGISYTQVNVYPSTIYVPYLWGVLPRSEWDALGDDPAQRIVDEIRAEVDDANALGGEAHFGDYTVYHNRKKSYTDLTEGEEYVVYAFGCDVTGFVTSPVRTEVFTEHRLTRVECSFSLSFESVRASSFAVNIVPSDNGVRYVAYTLPYEFLEKYASVEAMTEDVVDILFDLETDFSKEGDYVHTGRQSLSNYDLLGSECDPLTKQIVAVFGINDRGYRLTEISQGVVTTAQAGMPSSMTIGIEGLPLGYNGAEVTFTPSSKEMYFYDLVPRAYYDEFDSDDYFMSELLFYYGTKQLLMTRMTMGKATLTAYDGLMPGTEYMGVAFGVDKNVSTPLFKEIFRTGSVPLGGTAKVERIDLKIEDGDAYYAKDPSAFANCKGMAVVTCNPFTGAGAAECYAGCFQRLDPALSEQQMADLIVGRGDRQGEGVSYLLEWDAPSVAAALATDATGKAGPVLKREFTPEKSHVQDAPHPGACKLRTTDGRITEPDVPALMRKPDPAMRETLSERLISGGFTDSPAAQLFPDFGNKPVKRVAAGARSVRDLRLILEKR